MGSSVEINNNSIENSDEAPLIKTRESDEELPQLSDTSNASRVIIQRSPENFIETLGGKGVNFHPGSTSETRVKVEALTLNNYRNPNLVGGEGSSIKRGLWSNFARVACESRRGDTALRDPLSVGEREDVGKRATQLEPTNCKIADHLPQSDNRIESTSTLNRTMGGIRTKVLPASGFSQYLMKNSLRGKAVAHAHQGVRKENLGVSQSHNNAVDTSSSDDPSGRINVGSLVGGGNKPLDEQHDEICLREWLALGRHKLVRLERLHVFRQIVKLVDISHSQELILQHLQPSYFMISSSNEVRYIGSFVPSSQIKQPASSINQHADDYVESHLKRKKMWRDDGSLSSKHQNLGESYNKLRMPSSVVSNYGCQQSTLESLKSELKWYASPEELNNSACSFPSNTYSLGVLFFELFCCFETCEVHSAAMSDLCSRILPSCFLSDSPNEAAFCLWLLHPEPSSRPNSSDILQSDLVSEDQETQDLSFPEQSSASIGEEDAEADLLLHFLLNMMEDKVNQAAKLVSDAECLTADIEAVEKRYSSRKESLSDSSLFLINQISDKYSLKEPICAEETSRFSMLTERARLIRNFDQLENAYFSMRSKIELSESNDALRTDTDVLKICNRSSRIQNDTDARKESPDRLGTCFEGLCKYARHSKFELCGSTRSVDILNSANVICSLSFDRDDDYFAAAGASKKIKIFEFGALLNDSVDIHYPLIEMSCRSKLSCVCWNNYIKNYLASTDYEGVIQLWDASTGQGFMQYLEHQKRAWSVDFSLADPTKLASGSDDCSVKLWSINERNCLNTIMNVANVCCVQFSPFSSNFLAFGSADYKIHCYDLRMTRTPWCTLAGHGKAVSYVKFVDSVTVVSASTDNTLRLWDLDKTSSSGLSINACSLTFSGHTNEKNFVGLSVSDGYIACGSETNEVYAYYRALPMPMISHKFSYTDPIMGIESSDDNGQFVSSVCWRSRSGVLVAANSNGSINLLKMV